MRADDLRHLTAILRGPRQRWWAPVLSVAVVALVSFVPHAVHEHGRSAPLAPRSATSILLLLASSRGDALTGTIRESANLGLPDLPGSSRNGLLGTVTGLLSGTHSLRLWQSGTDKQRLAVLGTLTETDLVRSGTTLFTYDAGTGTSSRQTLAGLSRSQLARVLLNQILLPIVTGPDSVVTAGPDTVVAGRTAYTVAVRPKHPGSLVERLELAVDAQYGTLLRAALYAVGHQAPAFEARFTDIGYAIPPDRLFGPATGSLPTAADAEAPGSAAATTPANPPAAGSAAASGTTIGSGWSAVVRIPGLRALGAEQKQLAAVTTSAPGGRLLTTSLVSVLFARDGSVLLGAVPPARLRSLVAP